MFRALADEAARLCEASGTVLDYDMNARLGPWVSDRLFGPTGMQGDFYNSGVFWVALPKGTPEAAIKVVRSWFETKLISSLGMDVRYFVMGQSVQDEADTSKEWYKAATAFLRGVEQRFNAMTVKVGPTVVSPSSGRPGFKVELSAAFASLPKAPTSSPITYLKGWQGKYPQRWMWQ